MARRTSWLPGQNITGYALASALRASLYSS